MSADEARARSLVARLEGAPEGAAIVGRMPAGAARVCFGKVPVSAVTPEGVVLLEVSLADAEAAARLGHLLLHVVEGSPAPRAGEADCDAAVRRALGAEAAALGLELRLRRALGVEAPAMRYEFEEGFWGAAPGDREALVLAYLEAHPHGGPGVDALAEGYRRRCLGR
jgi:hypothetical protein